MKTAILTDSGCGMTVAQAKAKGIYLVPLQVIDENVSYQDGVDMLTEQLYELLRENHIPKTSMPTGEALDAVLQQIKQDGYEAVVAIPLSSGLSGTGNTMRIAAEAMGLTIEVIENYTTCDLQGHDAQLAVEYAAAGMAPAQIKEAVEAKVAHSGTLIVPNDIQHLKRGGRLTPLAAAAASLLKIKPILKIDPSTNGKIDVIDKVRTEKKALAKAVDGICELMRDKEGDIYVIHSDCLVKAQEIERQIKARCPKATTHIDTICAVISAHTGLDCLAIQYIEK